jgi:MFS transporter, YQGE family, putative transporter
MWTRSIARLKTELTHFHLLPIDVRRMLLSYALYLAAYPLIMTFMNAYLWRTSGNLWSVILYNLGFVLGVPVGFYLNGLLLKKFHILRLYFSGTLLQAVIPCLVVFFPLTNLTGILLYGLIYGCGAGLFWANKNYLDQQLTRGSNRMYYNSLGQIFDVLLNMIIPAVAGWFIVLVTADNPGPSFVAYKIIMVAAFFLLTISGLVVQFSHIGQITIKGMVIKHPGKTWNLMRLYHVLFNIQVGSTMVLTSIVVLILVGGEGILGTLQGVTAGLSAIVLYIIGRKATISSAWKFIGAGSLIFFVGTCILAGVFSWVGGLTYTLAISLAWASQWTQTNSVIMELMDKEEHDPEKQYAYVCDNEIFYNTGRVIGIAIISVIAILASEHAAIRWSPLIIGVLQLPLAWIISSIVNTIKQKETEGMVR